MPLLSIIFSIIFKHFTQSKQSGMMDSKTFFINWKNTGTSKTRNTKGKEKSAVKKIPEHPCLKFPKSTQFHKPNALQHYSYVSR